MTFSVCDQSSFPYNLQGSGGCDGVEYSSDLLKQAVAKPGYDCTFCDTIHTPDYTLKTCFSFKDTGSGTNKALIELTCGGVVYTQNWTDITVPGPLNGDIGPTACCEGAITVGIKLETTGQ